MPLSTAEFLWGICSWILLISLIAGVISTFGIYYASKVKDSALNLKIAEAELKAAKANQIAEEERLARVKIEQKIAPRSLSGEQQSKIAETMRPYEGQKYEIITYDDDPESVGLTTMIKQTLQAAGWEALNSNHYIWPYGSIKIAVTIEFSIKEFKDRAEALANKLEEQGILASARSRQLTGQKDLIRISVGKKP